MTDERRLNRLLLWVGLILTVAVIASTGLSAYNYLTLQDTTATVVANQRANTTALCTLRQDLQARIDSSEAFLEQHPNGFSGISAATIQSSVVNERHTISALSGLTC